MATLGKLVLMLEAKGGEQVLSTLRGIQTASNSVNNSLNQQTNSYKENQQAIYGTTSANKGLSGSFIDLIQSFAIFNRMQKQSYNIQQQSQVSKKTSLYSDIQEQRKKLTQMVYDRAALKHLEKMGASKGPDGKKIWDLNTQIGKQSDLLGNLSIKWDSLSKAVSPYTGALTSIFGAMGKLITFTAEYYQGVFTFVVPALTAIATKAVQAAAELESMNLRMQSIQIGQFKAQGFGNVESIEKSKVASKELLNIYKQIAIPSTYLTKDLFQAGSEMEAFGINSRKALQPAAMLAEVFGGTNEDLSMIVRQMGRMAAGSMPDSRALGRFGMNRAQIEKEMAKLPAGSQSPMLEAFIKIITENYGSLFSRLENSFNSKFASLQERFGFGMEKIGEPILRALMPAMQKLSDFIEQLDASGTLTMFGNALANVVNQLQDQEFLDLLENTFFDLIGLLHSWMMELTKTVKFFVGLYQFLKESFKIGPGDIISKMVAQARGKKLEGGFDLEKWAQGARQTFGNLPNVPGFDIANGLQFGQGYRKNFEKGKGNLAGIGKYDADLYKNESLISNIEKTRLATEDQNDKLDKIKDNTKKASDELSLQKASMGGRGGPLAQLGMSPTQMAFAGNVNMNKSSFSDPSLMNPVSMLEKAIVDIVRRNDSKTFRRF